MKMFPSKCTHTMVNFYQYLKAVNLGCEDGNSSDNTEIEYFDVRKISNSCFGFDVIAMSNSRTTALIQPLN